MHGNQADMGMKPMDQQQAPQYAKGMSVADANVEVVRMVGVRLVKSKLDRATRAALMAGVKAGKIGRLPKDGHKPEAFFHPNSIWNAKEARQKVANDVIRAVAGHFHVGEKF